MKILENYLNNWKSPKHIFDCKFPFLSGAMGFISYEAHSLFEKTPIIHEQGLEIPYYFFYFVDKVFIYDHSSGNLFSSCSGSDFDLLQERSSDLNNLYKNFSKNSYTDEPIRPTFSSLNQGSFKSNFTREQYIDAVNDVKSYIAKGETYQANISQRFETPFQGVPSDVYQTLININPVNYAGYVETDDFVLACVSPERLIQLKNNNLLSRPIAGTRRRGKNLHEDTKFYRELQEDAKEQAEHSMLVDLIRNDIGRVSEYGSVKIKKLAEITNYRHVMHLESEITGQISPSVNLNQILKATFPGGTITGVPKIRTIEIIAEVEKKPRGFYTGSLGYIDFSGDFDFNIIIRSIIFQNKKAYFHVGGGVTYDCNPDSEYKETLNKAFSQFSALNAHNGKHIL